jgi:TPR repeat protein
MEICQICQIRPPTKKCSFCPSLYCSNECQRKDWPNHKAECLLAQGLAEKDEIKAFALILKSANAGFDVAQVACGACLANGIGCAKDIDQAIFWFSKVDLPPSLNGLSRCYVEKNMMEKAEECAAKSANAGDREGQLLYGTLLTDRNNYRHGIYWLTESSNQDCLPAHVKLAAIYAVEKNVEKAILYSKKAAKHNHALSFLNLALLSRFIGDPDIAKLYLKRSIELGCPEAKEMEIFIK